ncbi:MAG: MerR family transcriptional regulator [Anaerolineaceae bacterium]|nr:MerR family transcriptional regulator [Anaerolineaceae bacterium]
MEDNQFATRNNVPVYNIKAVSRLVGLLPVTLRAWERRYGLPTPQRGGQGYRLYSEYDLRILRWLKSQLETGLSIGRAVEYLGELRSTGKDPAQEAVVNTTTQPVSLTNINDQLYEALTTFNDQSASETIRRAFKIYPVDQVLMHVIQPTMVKLGDAWHRGDLPVAVEHFATQFCVQNLMGMISSSTPPTRSGKIVAACAPGEMHQIGLLMLVVMLRWRGWDVKYLGQDLNLDRLHEALSPLHPKMLLFTATRAEAAKNLKSISSEIEKFPEPHPLLLLGGQAFKDYRLPDEIPAVYVEGTPTDAVETIEKLMHD